MPSRSSISGSPGKQAGGMRVRPHPAMHHVEMRHLARFQAEELADIVRVPRGRRLRRQLAADAVHVALRDVRRPDQVFVRQLVIALLDRWAARSARPPRRDARWSQRNFVAASSSNISLGVEPPEIASVADSCPDSTSSRKLMT